MSIICIAKGTATIGMTTRGADGKIISQTPARWEHDPDGGCVALWTMNPETEEQEAPARIYGDWQASEYLGDVLAELKPRRKVNLPDFPAIVRAAMADGMDICVYCRSLQDRPQMDAAGGVHSFRAGGRYRGSGQSRRPGAGNGHGPFRV